MVAPATGTQDAKAPATGASSSGAEVSPADRKGRPTPTRKEAEAKNRRPLVASAGDPKAARAEQRKANAEARARMNEAMNTGDERYMPVQHKGVQRRYIRDYVDARFSIGELFIPAAILILVVAFTQPVAIQQYFTYAVWGLLALVILDGFVLNYILKGRLRAKFGTVERGIPFYAVMRSVQLRPLRMPKPQVKRRQYPE
ncbi:MAG TPA: DUF3043 domain-containing protein [Micrococcales bacterium]|nr:DUF3043 domain-containing protein [Micrococcales bacterium]